MAFLTPVAASAATALTPEQTSHLRSFWSQYGVSSTVQDALIRKLEMTGNIDASTAGTRPTREVSTDYPDRFETITTYRDGSIVVTTVEKPDLRAPVVGETTSVTPFSITSCQTTASGSGYRNFYDCRVDASSGNVGLGFNISYSLRQGAYDKIISADTAFGAAAIGTLSPNPPTLTIPRATENANGLAFAVVTTTYRPPAGGTYSVSARAWVGKDTAYTKFYTGS